MFVTHIQETRFVEVIEPLDKGVATAEERDERRDILRDEERIEPERSFVGFSTSGVEVAGV